jgi:cytidyltransferase-like protein
MTGLDPARADSLGVIIGHWNRTLTREGQKPAKAQGRAPGPGLQDRRPLRRPVSPRQDLTPSPPRRRRATACAMVRHALIAGKFAPFHKGHQHLLETALAESERLTVLAYANPYFPAMPSRRRAGWIRALYPRAQVLVPHAPRRTQAPTRSTASSSATSWPPGASGSTRSSPPRTTGRASPPHWAPRTGWWTATASASRCRAVSSAPTSRLIGRALHPLVLRNLDRAG